MQHHLESPWFFYDKRIISLMGHADKSMIDRVYGKYVEGIELAIKDIKTYYGEDFWGGENQTGGN